MIISILIPPPHQDRFQVQAKCQLQNFSSVADICLFQLSQKLTALKLLSFIYFSDIN